MSEQPDLKAVIAGFVGRVPTVLEMRAALARAEKRETMLPESTYYEWINSGKITEPTALWHVANHFNVSFDDLLEIYGYRELPGKTLTATRKAAQKKRATKVREGYRRPGL